MQELVYATPGSAGSGGGGYQDSDARGAISVSGDLSYNSTTGVISFTQNDTWTNITGTPTTLAGYAELQMHSTGHSVY